MVSQQNVKDLMPYLFLLPGWTQLEFALLFSFFLFCSSFLFFVAWLDST